MKLFLKYNTEIKKHWSNIILAEYYKPMSVDGSAPLVWMINLSATTNVMGGDNTEVPFVFPALTTSSYCTDGVRFFKVTVVSEVSSFWGTLQNKHENKIILKTKEILVWFELGEL